MRSSAAVALGWGRPQSWANSRFYCPNAEYPAPSVDWSSAEITGGLLVAELMLFRRDADGRDVELSGSTVALDVELQRRVEAGLEQMLGIRFLASEYPTGPWHQGRIDTLGLDENGSPVVIEFKKGFDSGVLSQAVSYLSWLESAHHEFEALVQRVLGAEAAESINWRRPRMVCIAAGFSHHDRVAVQRLPERIDLVRYRIFEGGLLSLLLVDSSPSSPNPASSRRSRETVVGSAPAPVAPPPAGAGLVPECLRDLYAELDDALTAWGEVEVAPLRHYIAYRRLVNVASAGRASATGPPPTPPGRPHRHLPHLPTDRAMAALRHHLTKPY